MDNKIVVIEKETAHIQKEANDLVITNQLVYEDAATFLQTIKGLQKKIKETFDPIVASALKTHREAVAQKKKHLDPIVKIETQIKSKMLEYEKAQEQIRRAQEEKLARQAKAEEERKKKALEERAKKAEQTGKTEKAEELREQKEAVSVEAPILAPRAQTPTGISYRTRWTAQVIEFSKIPDTYKIANMPMLNKFAMATKGQVLVPGVVFKCEKEVASRAI